MHQPHSLSRGHLINARKEASPSTPKHAGTAPCYEEAYVTCWHVTTSKAQGKNVPPNLLHTQHFRKPRAHGLSGLSWTSWHVLRSHQLSLLRDWPTHKHGPLLRTRRVTRASRSFWCCSMDRFSQDVDIRAPTAKCNTASLMNISCLDRLLCQDARLHQSHETLEQNGCLR